MKSKDPWRQRMSAALPKKWPDEKQSAFLDAVEKKIQLWFEIEPEIKPYQERLTELAGEVDSLRKAIEHTGAKLQNLGLQAELEKAKADAVALGIPFERDNQIPLGGRNGLLDLYLITWRAKDALDKWNLKWRRKQGQPRLFSAELTKALLELYEQAHGSTRGFDGFLQALQKNDSWRRGLSDPPLPKLAWSTLKRRRSRG